MLKMHNAGFYYSSCFILLSLFFISCRDKPAPGISFYYWKTRFALNPYEAGVLDHNNVQSLYIRYFDVDLDPANGLPLPVSTIMFDSIAGRGSIIPVVYIKNRVFFEKTDTGMIDTLCKNIFQLVSSINNEHKITAGGIQFDCDWTEKTKDNFFYFLNRYKKISGQKVSATIRLHQVKYSERTGIPPVDGGVLMFYNIGAISPGDGNSIYEQKNALKYVSSLKQYPLPLDIALPVFSWGIGTRDGKVHYLLNKMYVKDFEKDTNFTTIAPGRYKAKHSFFKSGYYIKAKDEIKIENIGAGELEEMARMLKKNGFRPVKKVIFYDLDSTNLINYDSNIFQTVSQKFR